MKRNSLYLYSIMPLDIEHIDEICEDILKQYRDGVANYPLFEMTLVPEGNPVINKAEIFCSRYRLFKQRLDSMGIPSGVLVQATIGHGWVLSEMFPYQQYINMTDGEANSVVCPLDEGFKEYIFNALKTIALCKPNSIMIDDDFRLIYRTGFGCACPLHIKKFNESANTDIGREDLFEIIKSGTTQAEKYFEIYVEVQKQSVLEAARVMRSAINEVDKSIPVAFCCVGNNAEFGAEISEILSGEGNPSVVRINNGNYCVKSNKNFSDYCFKAAAQIAKLKDKVDVILAETDTCPQNRYSTSALSLHSHFTATILEGASGAKHWITRLSSFEPESGRAYRKILSKWRGFYEKLAEITPELKWLGCRIPVYKEAKFVYGENYDGSREKFNGWANCVLDKLGLPVYFSADNGGVVCLEGEMDKNFTDAEIAEMLKGTVFLASDTAKNLCRRGFTRYIGAEVQEYTGKTPSFERLKLNGNNMSVQFSYKELKPVCNTVEELSEVYHSIDNENVEKLFPGVIEYKNEAGGKVVTFCGTPNAPYGLTTAFSFLNYSRKQQLISILERITELPVYYPGDEEVYLKVARTEAGDLFCAVFNIGFDPIEEMELVFKTVPQSIEKLMPNGEFVQIDFSVSDKQCRINSACNTLEPVVLRIS